MLTVNEVIHELDSEVNMVGIHGKGGIGKTTLAKEICKRVVDGQLFDCVVFVKVSTFENMQQTQIGFGASKDQRIGKSNRGLPRAEKEEKSFDCFV